MSLSLVPTGIRGTEIVAEPSRLTDGGSFTPDAETEGYGLSVPRFTIVRMPLIAISGAGEAPIWVRVQI